MFPKLLLVSVNLILFRFASTDRETKQLLNFLLTSHQQPRQEKPLIIHPALHHHHHGLPDHFSRQLYSPLHHSCDCLKDQKPPLLTSRYPPELLQGLILPQKGLMIQQERKTSDFLKDKWKKAKLLLKGSLKYALNNEEPYYPLDPTASLKTAAKHGSKKKGVVVLRDKLGVQVYSNHPVTLVGEDGQEEEVLPGIERPPHSHALPAEDNDYDLTPPFAGPFRPIPISYHTEKPKQAFGMPSSGPSSSTTYETLSPSSEESLGPTSLKPSSEPEDQEPTTELEQQSISPTTTHPMPPHHHYPPPVTHPEVETEMQTPDPQTDPQASGSQDPWHDVRQPEDNRETERERQQSLEQERRPDQSLRSPAFDSNAGRRIIMHHKPPANMVLGLPRAFPAFESGVNSSGTGVSFTIDLNTVPERNHGWKPIKPEGLQEREIRFGEQTNEPAMTPPATSRRGQQQPADSSADTSNHVSRHVQPLMSLTPRMGSQPLPQVTTSPPATMAWSRRTTTSPSSTSSSIILSSSASYFASLDPSLSRPAPRTPRPPPRK